MKKKILDLYETELKNALSEDNKPYSKIIMEIQRLNNVYT